MYAKETDKSNECYLKSIVCIVKGKKDLFKLKVHVLYFTVKYEQRSESLSVSKVALQHFYWVNIMVFFCHFSLNHY